MRVLLCGGGTAGHVMPAIAMSEIIEKNFPGSVIAFAGRSGGKENEAYIKTKHKFYTVDISGISRSFTLNNLKTIFKLIKSGRIAKNIIKDFNPDIIIGTGGYVCYPFIRQGQRMSIKTIIHESNVAPGLVTKILGKKCDTLLLNHEATKEYLHNTKNSLVVGNPTRKSFDSITKSEARRRLNIRGTQRLIVSFGGSLGAEILNKSITEFMRHYVINNKSIYHIHATGRSYYDKIKDEHPELFKDHSNIKILPYIDDIPPLLIAADLAITRSGAITVSELSRSSTPSILIPSPNVTANHQYMNAKHMESLGASVLIEEKDLSAKKLNEVIFNLLENTRTLKRMSKNARSAQPIDTDVLIRNALKKLKID